MGLWIAGAGGVGREALDVALAVGIEVDGFLDDEPPMDEMRGLPVRRVSEPPDLGDMTFLVAIGNPSARLAVAARLESLGLRPTTLVHPRAVVAPEVELADGCLVMALAHLSSAVRLGRHAQVHYGATVGHDTAIEEGAIVLPGANVAGSVHLGRGSMVGSGAIILQGLSVGAEAVVGAGAVVTRDVPDGVVVIGSPATPLVR